MSSFLNRPITSVKPISAFTATSAQRQGWSLELEIQPKLNFPSLTTPSDDPLKQIIPNVKTQILIRDICAKMRLDLGTDIIFPHYSSKSPDLTYEMAAYEHLNNLVEIAQASGLPVAKLFEQLDFKPPSTPKKTIPEVSQGFCEKWNKQFPHLPMINKNYTTPSITSNNSGQIPNEITDLTKVICQKAKRIKLTKVAYTIATFFTPSSAEITETELVIWENRCSNKAPIDPKIKNIVAHLFKLMAIRITK